VTAIYTWRKTPPTIAICDISKLVKSDITILGLHNLRKLKIYRRRLCSIRIQIRNNEFQQKKFTMKAKKTNQTIPFRDN
ncbi:hypothetical protein ACP5PY_18015, partial [Photobacterium leiognathi subsp. mandapamensis]